MLNICDRTARGGDESKVEGLLAGADGESENSGESTPKLTSKQITWGSLSTLEN
jgi:hypothetical protein